MITYKNLLILKLSHLTEWKNDKEMYMPNDMVCYDGAFFTCEFLGDRRYVLRGYYENGDIWWERNYKDGKLHGRTILRYVGGKKYWEDIWEDGGLVEVNGRKISDQCFGWRGIWVVEER